VQLVSQARQAWRITRGLRRIVRDPITPDQARSQVADEVRRRGERFLTSLDRLVWPFPASPSRWLLECAGAERGDVVALVHSHGLDGALDVLRDRGVYVSYEEYKGQVPARRGSAERTFGPRDFFNPVVDGDYMAATGGSRGKGSPVQLSFSWQRRQGLQRPLRDAAAGVAGAPTAIWLPVLPSAAGFGAVMKGAAGGVVAERWFSQIPLSVRGITADKQLLNRALPVLNPLAGLPRPRHVPTDHPDPVLDWLVGALARHGSASVSGYASSLTALAGRALERGVSLDGAVAFPASEPVTPGKLAVIRGAGLRAYGMYAFTPEGVMGFQCGHCADEEYHLWEHDIAVVGRRRERPGGGSTVDAFCVTSLALEAPRVMLNVENDDFGEVRRGVACECPLGELGLTTRLADIRSLTKVVTAGISLDGEVLDAVVGSVLPAALGGTPDDYQFVQVEDGPSRLALRVHPRLGDVDADRARGAVSAALAGTDNGVLADQVWRDIAALEVVRAAPERTAAGKTLSLHVQDAHIDVATATSPTRGSDPR
jgi:hypothetical protein